MTKTRWIIVALSAALLVSLLRAQPSTQPIAPSVRWEYAELDSGGKGKFFVAPGKIVDKEDYTEFFHGLGGKGDAPNGEIDVLNAIGAMGWEVVLKEKDRFIFKRQVRNGG